jgi:hypothetical protein
MLASWNFWEAANIEKKRYKHIEEMKTKSRIGLSGSGIQTSTLFADSSRYGAVYPFIICYPNDFSTVTSCRHFRRPLWPMNGWGLRNSCLLTTQRLPPFALLEVHRPGIRSHRSARTNRWRSLHITFYLGFHTYFAL